MSQTLLLWIGDECVASVDDGTAPDVGDSLWWEDSRIMPGSGIMKLRCTRRAFSVRRYPGRDVLLIEVHARPARKTDVKRWREWQKKRVDRAGEQLS